MIKKSLEIGDYRVDLILDDFSQNSLQMLVQVFKGEELVAFKSLFFKR